MKWGWSPRRRLKRKKRSTKNKHETVESYQSKIVNGVWDGIKTARSENQVREFTKDISLKMLADAMEIVPTWENLGTFGNITIFSSKCPTGLYLLCQKNISKDVNPHIDNLVSMIKEHGRFIIDDNSFEKCSIKISVEGNDSLLALMLAWISTDLHRVFNMNNHVLTNSKSFHRKYNRISLWICIRNRSVLSEWNSVI